LPWLVLIAATGLGAVVGWGVAGLLDEAPEPVAATTTTATTTTTVAAPVADYRWEATGSFELGGATFVGAATIAEPGVVATRVEEAPWTARWSIRIDGTRTIDYVEEYRSPFLPGMFTVRFPNLDLARGAELLAYPLADETTAVWALRLDEAALPWTGPLDQDRLEVGGAVVVFDSVLLDDGGGLIEWYIEGDPWARGWLTAELTYREEGAAQAELTISRGFLEGEERPEEPGWAPERSDAMEMWHLDGTVLGGDPDREVTVTDLVLEVTATVYTYADEPVSIPVPPAG
jgi:hypothetical protein